MPFGPYDNLKDCVAKNQDKKNPAAYCATIMRKAESLPKKFTYGVAIENYDIEEIQSGRKGMIVSGTAVKEVISRNGIKYLAKELQKAAPTLRDRPILKDHKNDVDHIVGKVIDSKYDESDKSIKFKGVVYDEKIQEHIITGLINHVSIGASVKNLKQEESEGEKYVTAEGLEILELSVTPVPGIPEASIKAGESFIIALQEAWKNDEEDEIEMEQAKKAQVQNQKNEEVKKMESDENIKLAKESLSDAILAFDTSWKKEDLMAFNIESLKILLGKSKTKLAEKKEEVKELAKPKGVIAVEENKAPETNKYIIVPQGIADEALKGQLRNGKYVVENTPTGKKSIWKVPDYGKYRKY